MKSHSLKVILPICVVLASVLSVSGQRKAAQPNEPTLIPFRVGDKWGYSDVNKKILIEPKYDGARPFSNGRADVYLTNYKCGYIDKSGKEIIPIGTYDDCYPFSNGLAFVHNAKGYSVIDSRGRIILPSLNFVGGGWSEGLQSVIFRNGMGVIDKTGRIVIRPGKYSKISKFSEGVARVQIGSGDDHTNGFINRTGKLIFSTKYECNRICEFSEGLSAMYSRDNNFKSLTIRNGPFGFVNKSGNVTIPFKYQITTNFSGGLALVMDNDGSWFFIDKTDNKQISIKALKYQEACPFSNGLAGVMRNDKWGFIDRTGREVIPLKYDAINCDEGASFREGLAKVGLMLSNTMKLGFINKEGEQVIAVKYDMVSDFENGLAKVTLAGKTFYIDKKGTEYYEPATMLFGPTEK